MLIDKSHLLIFSIRILLIINFKIPSLYQKLIIAHANFKASSQTALLIALDLSTN